MTENEKSEILHRLKERFDTITDYENITVEIEGKEIEAVTLALKDVERLEDENHRNFVNSQHIISLLIEENKKIKGGRRMMNKQEVMYWLNQIKDDIRGGADDFDSKRKESLTYAIEYIGGVLANKPQAIRKCKKCGYFLYCYEEDGKLKFDNYCPKCGQICKNEEEKE